MKHVDIREAEMQLSPLLEQGEPVVITRAGEPIAVLVPYNAAVQTRRLGLFADQATMHADFDELPLDIAAAFSKE